jgi:hypothetical protein
MATIDDGKGKNGKASVSSVQRLNVSAKNAGRIFYASRDFGSAYNLVAESGSVAAGAYTMYLKNTSSTQNLFISVIEFHSVENTKWKIWEVSGTAAGGAVNTPAELNIGKNIPAPVSAMDSSGGTITGLTNVTQLGTHRNTALGDSEMDFGGAMILGPGDAIAIEMDTGTTGIVSHDLKFWMEDIGAA